MDEPRERSQTEARLRAFGRWVRLLRQARELSQEQLGQRAGIDQAIISRIERGGINAGIAYLWPLADALGVRVQDLFPDKDQPLLLPRE